MVGGPQKGREAIIIQFTWICCLAELDCFLGRSLILNNVVGGPQKGREVIVIQFTWICCLAELDRFLGRSLILNNVVGGLP